MKRKSIELDVDFIGGQGPMAIHFVEAFKGLHGSLENR